MWLSEIDRYACGSVVKLLVGNKADLESKRVVKAEDAKRFADQYGMLFMEASAKSGKGVEDAFLALVNDIFTKRIAANPTGGSGKPSDKVDLDASEPVRVRNGGGGGGCCG